MHWIILATTLFLALPAQADSERDIAFILGAENPPKGVVFEVISGQESDLRPALESIQIAIDKLKQRHPNMRFAVVSHGREQFGLLKTRQSTLPKIHQQVKNLVQQHVPVAVCGTHAAWNGNSPHDFPDYVEVPPSGPGEILRYQRQGYALIRIDI